jgi:acyl carrier protein
MSQEMFRFVAHHLVEHFGIEPDTVSPTATLEDLGLDSMALVELLLVFEEEFGMPMPEDDDSAPRTLGELVERLERARTEVATAGTGTGGGAGS